MPLLIIGVLLGVFPLAGDSLRVLAEIGIAHASLRAMFRSLGRAKDRGYRDQIARACFTHASSSGDVSLCLYDVTTLYFETEEDSLGRLGIPRNDGHIRIALQRVAQTCTSPERRSRATSVLKRCKPRTSVRLS